MAKESLKAREVKRQKLVDKYAAKRAKLKAEGDYVIFLDSDDTISKTCIGDRKEVFRNVKDVDFLVFSGMIKSFLPKYSNSLINIHLNSDDPTYPLYNELS